MILEKLNKKTKVVEISVQLLNTCSNGCDFCIIHNLDTYKYSKDNLYKVQNSITSIITANKCETEFDIILQGGEIFDDCIPDSQILDYYDFILAIIDVGKKINKKINLKLTTNLLYTKTKRVLDLLMFLKETGVDISIGTSYDFIGRFHTQEKLDLFLTNLTIFKDYISPISITLTKQNIQALMYQFIFKVDTITKFNEFQNDYDICFETYFPDKNTYRTTTPTEDEVLNFYYFMIEKYPNIQPIKNLFKLRDSMTKCACNYLVLADGKITSCKEWIFDKTLWNDPLEDRDCHIQKYMEYYGCLTCSYFKRCPMDCFYVFSSKLIKHRKDCMFKKIFNFIKTGKKEFFNND